MKVDAEKLRSAVKRLAQERRDKRISSDLMQTVRPLLRLIEDMRTPPPAKWSVIADALAEQGVTEKGGKPITEKRLTSVYFKLVEQERKKAARKSAVTPQSNSAAATQQAHGVPPQKGGRALLAPELTQSAAPDDAPPPLTEEEILRSRREKLSHLYKRN